MCRQGGFSGATFYTWRGKYGGTRAAELHRTRELETKNASLKKRLAEAHLDIESLKVGLQRKAQAPQDRRRTFGVMLAACARLSERKACRLVGLSCDVWLHPPQEDEAAQMLIERIASIAQSR